MTVMQKGEFRSGTRRVGPVLLKKLGGMGWIGWDWVARWWGHTDRKSNLYSVCL